MANAAPPYKAMDCVKRRRAVCGASVGMGTGATTTLVVSCRKQVGGRCLLACIAAGSLLLTTPCIAFHAHLPPARRAQQQRSGREGAGTGYYRCRQSSCSLAATRAPPEPGVLVTTPGEPGEAQEGDTSAVLDDLARQDPAVWEGHEYGFDWYLEKARRGMTGPGGFSPLRMNFWRPAEEEVEELKPWDSAYIILRNLAQMVGFPSVDGAPLAKIETYTGSWLTFLQKVSNGRLEDLAGGPLFLMLEKYFKAEG